MDWYDDGGYSGEGKGCDNCANSKNSGMSLRVVRGGGWNLLQHRFRAASLLLLPSPDLVDRDQHTRCDGWLCYSAISGGVRSSSKKQSMRPSIGCPFV